MISQVHWHRTLVDFARFVCSSLDTIRRVSTPSEKDVERVSCRVWSASGVVVFATLRSVIVARKGLGAKIDNGNGREKVAL